MTYCEDCRRVFDVRTFTCPHCEGTHLRPATDADICYLIELPALTSTLLTSVLEEAGIPALRKGRLGAGFAMNIGLNRESERFYVPFSHLKAAQELTEELLAPDETEGVDTTQEDFDSADTDSADFDSEDTPDTSDWPEA